MYSDKHYTCPKCGLTLPRFSGPTPEQCPACMPAKNRARAIERLRKLDPEAAEKIVAAVAAGREANSGLEDDPPEMKSAKRAAAPTLLAIALSITSKVQEATAIAELSVLAEEDPEWFKGVVRAARRKKAFVESQPAAAGGIIQAVIARLALRAWLHADRIPPAQAASSARAWAQVAETIQGGDGKKVHTEVELVFPSVVVHKTVDEVQAENEA